MPANSAKNRPVSAPGRIGEGERPVPTLMPALDAGTLFAGRSEVVIAHGAETYRLRLTRQNKLILTK